jgi:glyoxylate/hydroxypyruvate reductase A
MTARNADAARPLRILFSARPGLWDDYARILPETLQARDITAEVVPVEDAEWPDETVDYIVFAPNGPITDFSPFSYAKAVLSLWAGVETVTANPTLTQPLARMVDDGLTVGMVQWVLAQVLRHHLSLDSDVVNPSRLWKPRLLPLPRERPVGILGLGRLGAACASALASLGFPVSGWSRSVRSLPGIACHHGHDGLETVLRSSQILVLLLPKTPATESLLDAPTLALLPRGASLINPGRGALIDEAALLAALTSGHLSHATLDVFRTEPLPAEHPFWAHPNVTVSPHIAAETRPATASTVIVENIRRSEAGEPLLYRVDRQAGY